MTSEPFGAARNDLAIPEDAVSAWVYIQTVLDDALDAVHSARVHSAFLTESVERYKRVTSELEDRCRELETRLDEARSDSEQAEEIMLGLRRELEVLQERYAQALLSALNHENTIKRARRLEERLRVIVEAVARLDEKIEEIHEHYGNDLDAQPELIEEINFTRDETLETIRRAVASLRAVSRRAHA